MTLGQMLAQTAERLPNKTAIRFRDQETTYADFDKRANQVANGLIALDVQPGDRVALLLHNRRFSWKPTTASSRRGRRSCR